MRQRNNPLPSVALLALMLSTGAPVMASSSTSPQEPGPATMGELEALHTRNVILQAKVQSAQLERQLEENQSGNVTPAAPAPVPAVGFTSLPGTPARPPAAGSSRPVVLEINGRDKHLRATLQLPSGQTLIVAPGNHIPGMEPTVRSIQLAGVTLSDGSLLVFGD